MFPPHQSSCALTVCQFREDSLQAIIPPHLETSLHAATLAILSPAQLPSATGEPSEVKWQSSSAEGNTLSIRLPPSSASIKQITFHRRGDYIATVCPCFAMLPVHRTDRADRRRTRPGFDLDPPNFKTPFPKPVPKSQGESSKGHISPNTGGPVSRCAYPAGTPRND